MKIGAELLIRQWGRPMAFYRDGVLLFEFKGRVVQAKPATDDVSYSFDQNHCQIIGAVSDFVAGSPPTKIRPVKFDVVKYLGEDYTVQRGYFAGADEDELCKMDVIGGTA